MLMRLEITHFRNLTQWSSDLDPHCNLIVGPNGSGKSSILEAIYFASCGRSFRATQLSSLIQYGELGFQIVLHRRQVPHVIGIYKSKETSTIRVDGLNASSHAAIAQVLPVLYFNPERIQQFLTSSKKRRQFLDWGVFYHYPEFIGHWQKMTRFLKQRNAALKRRVSDAEIRLWDMHLVEVSEPVDEIRQDYLRHFMGQLRCTAGAWMDEMQVNITYYRGWPKDQSLLEVLEATRAHDRQIGHTTHGPHRADLRMRVRRATLQDVLSRGQQKILLSYLNLAAAEYFKIKQGYAPIVLMDDLSSELDQNYRKQLIEKLLSSGSQVFLTSILEENLVQYLDRPRVITLNQG